MLVITRKPGESIRIGDGVRIEVVSVKGKTIRLGIEAGPETLILREEIFQRQGTPPQKKSKEAILNTYN